MLLILGAGVFTLAANDGSAAFTGLFQNTSVANRIETRNKGARSLILFIQWMPLMLLPIIVAQAVSEREQQVLRLSADGRAISRIAAEVSPVCSAVISRNFTAGTSMCKSMRSSKGPEMRPR